MKYSRTMVVAGAAACMLAVGSFAACVGDSETTGDATAPDTGSDVVNGTDSATGCAARTADDNAGLFVAQTGIDVSACGTRSNPCKTLTYSLAAAKSSASKTTLYVASGTYTESITIDTPLTIEGGWSEKSGTWSPICDATTSTAVTIQGTSNTAVAVAFTGSGTLRDVKVASKTPAEPGESLYGIFVTGAATSFTLDQVVVDVAAGGAGAAGTPGASGANATDAGCTSGNGSSGGAGSAGGGAAAGTVGSSGYVTTNGGDAGAGLSGQNGSGGGAGACASCEFASGTCQTTCTIVVKQLCATNGMSGCAGAPGSGGGYGVGGGASIGVIAWDAHVTVFGGLFTVSNGGNGGAGGAGGDGGAGSSGGAGPNATCLDYGNPGCVLNSCSGTLNGSSTLNGGTAGGGGGSGGPGGQGGGGSGGVSYAIVQGGNGGVALNGNPKLAHGDGGTGGAAGGANGVSADRFP